MNDKVYFSPSRICFYPQKMVGDGSYVDLPDDICLIDGTGYFMSAAPSGKQLVVINNMPAWADIKPSELHTWDGGTWFITDEDEATLVAKELAERQEHAGSEVAAKKEEALARIKMLEVTLKHFPDDAEASVSLEKWELYLIKLDKYKFGTRLPMPSAPK